MTFICYPKCSTCKKARAWLEKQGFSFTERDIKAQPPTQEELREWHRRSRPAVKEVFQYQRPAVPGPRALQKAAGDGGGRAVLPAGL